MNEKTPLLSSPNDEHITKVTHKMTLDYTTYVTAEGDRIVLELQSARYLIRQVLYANTPGTPC